MGEQSNKAESDEVSILYEKYSRKETVYLLLLLLLLFHLPVRLCNYKKRESLVSWFMYLLRLLHCLCILVYAFDY